ncbi:hypothetical protein [Azospirillum agricola]|uniref:hypothetical protein n=1 Tax=Azospirillum agricola TaxID=1720247 RepID=UPI000A0F3732|nr:hypothetical protein [Azospirillum agricola]SMH62834.1 hypothetical protein SAMN02982994_6657 [Azospirillum lipoferum]
MTSRPTTEIDRAAAGYWNSDPVSPTNPGGLDESEDGTVAGHVDNFPAAVQAVGLMTQWVGEQIGSAEVLAEQVEADRQAAETAAALATAGAGDTIWGGLAGGTANGLVVTPAVPVTGLYDGLTVRWAVPAANTDAVTLVVGTAPVKPLRDALGAALVAGILSADMVATATYVASAGHWRLAAGVGGVRSFAGRRNAVAPAAGDYTAAMVGAVGQGWHTIPLPAAAIKPRLTSGAVVSVSETATYKVLQPVLMFDAASPQYGQVAIPMPVSANLAAGIMIQYVWTAASGSGSIVMAVQAQWQRDGDTLDAAWGVAVTVTDTLLAAGKRHISAVSGVVTPAGTSGSGCTLLLQVYRDAAHASDTLAVSSSLLEVRVLYSVNASVDA